MTTTDLFRYVPQVQDVLRAGQAPDDRAIALLLDRDRQLEDFVSREVLSRGAEITVAALNTPDVLKERADFVCDDSDDQVEVQAAVDLARNLSGGNTFGHIRLLGGRFLFSDRVDCYQIGVRGSGGAGNSMATVIQRNVVGGRQDNQGMAFWCTGNDLSDLKIVLSGGAAPAQPVVFMDSGGVVERVRLESTASANAATLLLITSSTPVFVRECIFAWGAIQLHAANATGTNRVQVHGCWFHPTNPAAPIAQGRQIYVRSDGSLVMGNTLIGGLESVGIYVDGQACVVAGNRVQQSGREGILVLKSDNLIHGNMITHAGQSGTNLYDAIRLGNGVAHNNNVQANIVRKFGVPHTRYGIRVDAGCLDNLVTNNDLKDSGNSGDFSDAGTGTITIPGNRPGGIGTAGTFAHTQGTAATTWTITHNLGFRPNAQVFDTTGAELEGDVVHTSTSVLTITFSAASAGSAYLS